MHLFYFSEPARMAELRAKYGDGKVRLCDVRVSCACVCVCVCVYMCACVCMCVYVCAFLLFWYVRNAKLSGPSQETRNRLARLALSHGKLRSD